MIKRSFASITLGLTSFLFLAAPAFAHVVVTPKQVGIAQTQVFDMSVPTEKNNPTVGVKLLIPAWIRGDVMPNVKPGWTITVVKDGDVIKEIDWTGGTIPPGQRDDFFFQTQAPSTEVTLKWKAIQMYQDGSTVEWTHDPTSNPEDDSAPPPYSTTKVVNDLKGPNLSLKERIKNKLPLAISFAALAFSVLALGISIQKKRQHQ